MIVMYFNKISVLNTDIQKALDPSIWPLRVRVREFVHYSNKPKQSGSLPKNNATNKEITPQTVSQGRHQFNFPDPSRLAVPTFSRFEPLMAGNMLNNIQ